jgi:type I restriction enzyme, S subunit
MKAGWQTRPLAELCEVFGDGDWIESKDQSVDGIRLIQTGNVGEGVFKDRGEKARYISEETFKRLRCTEIFEGDCLISRLPDPAGRSCILPDTGERMITAVDCTIVRFNTKQALPEFFNYYTQSRDYLSTVDGETTGTTRKRISRSKLAEVPIPVPPIPEQQRIVTLLDEAFDGIATAKAHAEKNLQNARAIFESHLQSVFTQRGDGWVERRLDEIAEFSQGIQVGVRDQKNAPEVGFVRFIRIVDYTQGTDDIRYVQNPGSRYWVNKADLVMVRYGTPGLIGRGVEGVIANNLFKITVADKSLLNDFLAYALGRESVQRYLSTQGASTMPALTFKQLGAVVVPYPKALAEQAAIVSLLDTIHGETQRLESVYQQKLTSLDELKKSLLSRAFSGAL